MAIDLDNSGQSSRVFIDLALNRELIGIFSSRENDHFSIFENFLSVNCTGIPSCALSGTIKIIFIPISPLVSLIQ